MNEDEIYSWTPDTMIEITLNHPDDFLKIKETLTRIGINPSNSNKIYQTCHIFHKRGKYYLIHFKELFLLNGKHTNLSYGDIAKRNTVIKLLSDWALLSVINMTKLETFAPLKELKVISHPDKKNYELIPKYTFKSINNF